jgi:hypothetical protein
MAAQGSGHSDHRLRSVARGEALLQVLNSSCKSGKGKEETKDDKKERSQSFHIMTQVKWRREV